ncbi:MAG: hypothetical protein MJZ14_11075 [Paludibacteraceae bacterium]|nr:hypothetical protein [Paludibacteraceae bacterium]
MNLLNKNEINSNATKKTSKRMAKAIISTKGIMNAQIAVTQCQETLGEKKT